MVERLPNAFREYGLTDSFNLDREYECPYYVALDQGLTLLMIENYRTQLLWRLTSRHPAIQQALARAGFLPGAQEEPVPPRVRHGNPGARVAIPRLRQPPTLDGDLSEWRLQEPLELAAGHRNLEKGAVSSNADASLLAYLGWDEDAFYVAGIVRDETLMNRYRGRQIYEDDCVEIFFDLDGDGFWFNQNPLDAQIGFAPTGPDDRAQTWVWGPIDQHVPQVHAASQRREGSYQVEMSIPWSVIGGRPKADRPFRFAIALHDRDDEEGKSAKLIWSVDKETDPGRLLFGEARLGP
jgi:hypothetical protein